MSAAKQSPFEAWFVAQYGARPSELRSYEIAKDVASLQAKLAELYRLSRACDEWDVQHDAALRAWAARGSTEAPDAAQKGGEW
jgi:hypothetical protein